MEEHRVDEEELHEDSEEEATHEHAEQAVPPPTEAFIQLMTALLNGNRPRPADAGSSNDQLINRLVQAKTIRSERVEWAMRTLSRGLFVPRQHESEAFIDAPLHLAAFSFNMSAPHVYAICLEALQIEEGHDFLDIGSGTGHMTALGAILVGPTGSSLGLDVRNDIVQMGREQVAAAISKLSDVPARVLESLSKVKFELRNCFLPDIDDRVFDRIHAGASCPVGFIDKLLTLLKPGGCAVFPCGDELLKIIKGVDGGPNTRQMLAQVRYGTLLLPTETEIKVALVENERKHFQIVRVPASSDEQNKKFQDRFAEAIAQRWQQPLVGADIKLDVGMNREDHACYFVHREVLAARSDHFRAMFNSGMRDANTNTISWPDTSPSVAEALLQYFYTENVKMTAENVPDLLELASFYQIPRLTALCEEYLTRTVDIENAAEMLELADGQYGAPQLKRFCLNFIVENHSKVKETSAFASLSKELVGEILTVACARLSLLKEDVKPTA